jgi:4-aminobutyrate aminotransferase-like enzyme
MSARGAVPDPSGTALPRIVVPPPGPRSRALAARGAASETGPAVGILNGAFPIAWAAARGANVVDLDGNRYVDLTGGFGAALVGHRNPRVVAAIERQASRLLHGLGDAAPHPERVALAAELSSRGPIRGGRVYFAGSGAEAVDLALKTAHLATGRPGIVAFEGGYHGTSLGALRATSRPEFRLPFEEALAPATLRVPFADLDAALVEIDAWIGNLGKPRLGALIIEPVLGRDGVVLPPPGWLAALGRAARERALLVVADEILTGGGRTGRMWASRPLDPDLVAVGKGITGGTPLAALVGRREIMAAWETGGEARHATTFMAHPLAVAATRAALAEIRRRDLPARARAIGRDLRAGLARIRRRYPTLVEARGAGGLWGIDLMDPETGEPDPHLAKAVAAGLATRGYLALAGGRYGNVIVLTPPLTITSRQLAGFLAALDATFADHG